MYTIFGKVIDGWDALDLIEKEPNDAKDRPLNEVKIYTVTIHANPIAENEQAWFQIYYYIQYIYFPGQDEIRKPCLTKKRIRTT